MLEVKNKIKERRYYPLVVSENGTEEKMPPEEDTAVWTKFDALPEEKKGILLSFEMPKKIKEMQEKLNLADGVMAGVSLCIRNLFFGELSLSACEDKISSLLGNTQSGDLAQAKVIREFIQKEILTIKPKPKVEEVLEGKRHTAALISVPLLQALSKYESLGNQLVTQERIRVKSQTEPVRPSLLYWLKYYRDELGVGHHDSVQRGNFLFRSENGKRLSAEERERVNLMLKSVEENIPLAIDTERSEIVFPHFEANTHPDTEAPREAERPANTVFQAGRGTHFGNISEKASAEKGALSFTSSHVFPAEKEVKRPGEKVVSPPPSAPRVPVKSNPFHIRPVSLGEDDRQ